MLQLLFMSMQRVGIILTHRKQAFYINIVTSQPQVVRMISCIFRKIYNFNFNPLNKGPAFYLLNLSTASNSIYHEC